MISSRGPWTLSRRFLTRLADPHPSVHPLLAGIRVSVGIEWIDDIIADFVQAFEAISKSSGTNEHAVGQQGEVVPKGEHAAV